MTPDYYLCDECKTEHVETKNRLRFRDGCDDLGEPRFRLVDLCPGCMAMWAQFIGTSQDYMEWASKT